MKLAALIVDDEPLAHKVILNYIKETPLVEIVGQCYSATEALHFLQDRQVDLLFLDIQMPKIQGLDLLRILDKRPLVIITSAYKEYALESYELDVCDYLLKPFRLDRFLKAVHKAFTLFKLKSDRDVPPDSLPAVDDSVPETLLLKVDRKHIQIDVAKIAYLEGYGNYVKVWIENDYLLTPRTLSSFESKLPVLQFIRIHKSYILNKEEINYLEGNRVFLKSGVELPLGKLYKKSLMSVLG